MNTLLKIIKFLFLNVIIIFSLEFLPVLANSYQPPPMKGQKPQRATVSGSRGSCLDYSESVIPLFPQAEKIFTTLDRPVFLFQLKSPLNNPVYFSLVADDEVYPVTLQKIESTREGLLVFEVPKNIKLKPNKTYRLNFVIVCNEKRPSHNWSVSTLVTMLPSSPSSLSLSSEGIIEQASILSQAGLWFDALELIYQKNLVNEANFNKLLENYRSIPYLTSLNKNS